MLGIIVLLFDKEDSTYFINETKSQCTIRNKVDPRDHEAGSTIMRDNSQNSINTLFLQVSSISEPPSLGNR